MPKRVQLPDGNIGEFPDDMPDAQIEAVLQKQYAPPSTDPSGRTPTGEPAPGDTRNGLQRFFDNLITRDPRREEWQSPTKTKVDAGARGVAENVAPVISHPIKTIGNLLNTIGSAINNSNGLPGSVVANIAQPMIQNTVEDFQQNGAGYALPHLAGQAAGMAATGEVAAPIVGKVASTGAKILQRGTEAVTGTSPSILLKKPVFNEEGVVTKPGGLVPRVQDENLKGKLTADEANAKAADTHMTGTQDALDKQRQLEDLYHNEVNKKAEEIGRQQSENAQALSQHQQATRASAELEGRLNQNERAAKTQLKAVEDRVHTEADNEYKQLREKLDGIEADPEQVDLIRESALDSVDPAVGKPPILDKFEKMLKRGDAPTYEELDRFRSELTSAMRKGNLPGTTYNLYDQMLNGNQEAELPGIVDEMQRIGKDHGVQELADHARNSWRQWAEAFRDRTSPLKSVLSDPEEHGLLKNMRGQQSYLDRLRAFGPDGEQLANSIENDLTAAQNAKATYPSYGGVRVPQPKAPSLHDVPEGDPTTLAGQMVKQPERPTFPEKPPEVVPEQHTIGPQDIQAVKAEALRNRANAIRSKGTGIVTTLGAYRALSNAFHGNWAEVPTLLGEGGAAVAATYTLGNLLDHPAIVKALTKPTARDVAMIPPELARDLEPIAAQAKAKGIKISPALATAISAASNARWYNQDAR